MWNCGGTVNHCRLESFSFSTRLDAGVLSIFSRKKCKLWVKTRCACESEWVHLLFYSVFKRFFYISRWSRTDGWLDFQAIVLSIVAFSYCTFNVWHWLWCDICGEKIHKNCHVLFKNYLYFIGSHCNIFKSDSKVK